MSDVITRNPRLRNFVVWFTVILPIVSLAYISFFGTGLEAASTDQELSFEDLEQRVPSPFQQSLGLTARDDSTVAQAETDESDDSEDESAGQTLGEADQVAATETQPTNNDQQVVQPTDPVDPSPVQPVVPDPVDVPPEDSGGDPGQTTDPVDTDPVCDAVKLTEWQKLYDDEVAFQAAALSSENTRHTEAMAEIESLAENGGVPEEAIRRRNAEMNLHDANIDQIQKEKTEHLLALELSKPPVCTTEVAQ